MQFDEKFDQLVISVLGTSEMENLSSIDSIAYVELLVVLQGGFKIKFSTQEFSNLKTISQIKESLVKKLAE